MRSKMFSMATAEADFLVNFHPKVEEKLKKVNEVAARRRVYRRAWRAIVRRSKVVVSAGAERIDFECFVLAT